MGKNIILLMIYWMIIKPKLQKAFKATLIKHRKVLMKSVRERSLFLILFFFLIVQKNAVIHNSSVCFLGCPKGGGIFARSYLSQIHRPSAGLEM